MIFTDFSRYFLDYLLNFMYILYKLDLPETWDFTWTFDGDVGSFRATEAGAWPLAAGRSRAVCAWLSGARCAPRGRGTPVCQRTRLQTWVAFSAVSTVFNV